MTKEELQKNKSLFIIDCLKFLEKKDPIDDQMQKFAIENSIKYFGKCEKFLQNASYDFISSLNQLRYAKIFLDKILEFYLQGKMPYQDEEE